MIIVALPGGPPLPPPLPSVIVAPAGRSDPANKAIAPGPRSHCPRPSAAAASASAVPKSARGRDPPEPLGVDPRPENKRVITPRWGRPSVNSSTKAQVLSKGSAEMIAACSSTAAQSETQALGTYPETGDAWSRRLDAYASPSATTTPPARRRTKSTTPPFLRRALLKTALPTAFTPVAQPNTVPRQALKAARKAAHDARRVARTAAHEEACAA